MITLKKIRTLKERVQIRRLGGLFHLKALGNDIDEIDDVSEYFLSVIPEERKGEGKYLLSTGRYEDLYYLALDILGESPADWDFEYAPEENRRKVRKFPISLYLDGLRSPYNVGSLFRSAECFGVSSIVLRPGSASPEHDRAKRTAMGAVDLVPYSFGEIDSIGEDVPVFALELGGVPLCEFEFPERGICIVGSEEDGVSKCALERAARSLGKVSIPIYGQKGSLNVASSAAILLHSWTSALVRM